MSQIGLLRFNPENSETNGILDLSSIVDKYDTYSKGSEVYSNQFAFSDLQLRIVCYPKGPHTAKSTNSVALFIAVLNCAVNDERKLVVSKRYRSFQHEFTQSMKSFKKGFGWNTCMTYQELKQCSTMHIKIKFHRDPFFAASTPSNAFLKQQERMYKLSELHGDVTLVIKLPSHNHSNHSLSPPPNKKRKLNDAHQCSVCDQEFQSKHGLKIHQSNKQDEAHKKYKKTNNDADTDTGLDCNPCDEIKVSSLILRSASKVFDRMLDTNMREKQENRIEIDATCMEDVKAMSYFMCTNVLKSNCNAFSLMALAHYYEMESLFEQCVHRIIHNITIQNFSQTVHIFDKFQVTTEYQRLITFAKQNTEELKSAPGYETIPHSFKCWLLN